MRRETLGSSFINGACIYAAIAVLSGAAAWPHLAVIVALLAGGISLVVIERAKRQEVPVKPPSLARLARMFDIDTGETADLPPRRNARRPPPRGSVEPRTHADPQKAESESLRWRKPRIPFYPHMGREDLVTPQDACADEEPTSAADDGEPFSEDSALPYGDDAPPSGHFILPPAPPGLPVCVALPREADDDGILPVAEMLDDEPPTSCRKGDVEKK